MISDRSYRKALTIEKAIEELRNNSGTQFDPSLIELFIETLAESKEYNPYHDIKMSTTLNRKQLFTNTNY